MVDSLGAWLRHARKSQRIDLEDAVRSLRIRPQYLQALEVGDYEALPGPTQVRGFLRNYARFLGLPVEEALARYDAEFGGKPLASRPAQVVPPKQRGERTWAPPPPSLEQERVDVRASASGGLVRVLGAALLFFAFLAIGSFLWLQFGAKSPTSDAANSTSVSADVPSTPDVQPAATLTPKPTPSFPVSSDGTVTVRLVPTSHAWISVTADDTVVFQGIADPQRVIEASAAEILIVATGDGGAFRIYVNGTDWDLLGGPAEVVRRAWTPLGETLLEGS